jgi:uncharacterized repeat protein (TIGR03843 family)
MPSYLVPERALAIISGGEMRLLGEMPRASNYTFAATVSDGSTEGLVIYKPQAGEAPLYDFPDGTLYAREVAAFFACESLGWDFVPPTVARAGVHGVGSVQVCINGEPTEHYLTLVGGEHDDVMRRICAFDIVVNNADRKSGHVIREVATRKIWAIDHGVCFHVEDKLRTVIWDFAGEPLPDEVSRALERLVRVLSAHGDAWGRLVTLLSEEEVEATGARAAGLLEAGRFPSPPEDRRPYPWPPI